jgi:hypothetical protein
MAEETVNVNPDGSTTFEGGAGEESTMPPVEDAGADGAFEKAATAAAGTDPLFYLVLVALALGVLFFIYYRRSKEDEDDFFTNLDGEKVREVVVGLCYELVIQTNKRADK